jgi:aconitate hydratase
MNETRHIGEFEQDGSTYRYFRLDAPERVGRLPFSIRILLENALRTQEGREGAKENIDALLAWPLGVGEKEIPFMPARVVLQDFTGVPAIVDLAALRSALSARGRDPHSLNPVVPVDLVVDHSVQVDYFGTPDAYRKNVEREYERNRERYMILKWAREHFRGFRVVPPGTGIVHQVNLEFLSRVVMTAPDGGVHTAFPDTLLGTDSHTTMINGIGVLGWGVGGIEAEAVMLGEPYFLMLPPVIGVKLSGRLREGATATDLVLTVTQMLRRHGAVDKFVEFCGPGLSSLSLPDRATIANMSPEFGATVAYFPVDAQTLAYLAQTGREDLVPLVRAYTERAHLFRTGNAPDPEFTETLTLDLASVEPCVAGPGRPQDRVPLGELKTSFARSLPGLARRAGGLADVSPGEGARVEVGGVETVIGHGSVVIAAITSCTNTSNPSVLVGAGLLAQKAVMKGLTVKPYVKTSLAPGSRVVTNYLTAAGLLPSLESLGFHVVGYGCTTCIGNSGPLPPPVARAVEEKNLVVAAVLSGNRNFEARIHPQVRANYLASPMLVVAFALAGRIDIDFEREPLGTDTSGRGVYLRDIWPSGEEIREALTRSISPSMFKERYSRVFEGDEHWRNLPELPGDLYSWDPSSTYIKEPPFLGSVSEVPLWRGDIEGARILVLLGDSVTTDHISPAGAISPRSPAGEYLLAKGVSVAEFNTYGARRGNHELMVRGTFANPRLRNLIHEGVEGGTTVHFPTGETLSIYEAAMRYGQAHIPLIVLAGREYGIGSSRDWAAKGTALLGVRAVIAESFERIHRANLIGMGVLPLEFLRGSTWRSLGISGRETLRITGLSEGLEPRKVVGVSAVGEGGRELGFRALVRIDSQSELECYMSGGILPSMLRHLLARAAARHSP